MQLSAYIPLKREERQYGKEAKGKYECTSRKEKKLSNRLTNVLRATSFYGAEGRTRTGMGSTQRFLRPPRLPIPPLRQVYFNFPLPDPPLELGGTFRRDIKTKTIILFSRTPYYQGLHTPTDESTK
jgi:hypothetical protein